MDRSFDFYMTSVGITKPDQTSKTFPVPPGGQRVFLDSTAKLSSLPAVIVNAIIAEFPGATQDPSSGLYKVDCSVASQSGTVNFGFGSTTIKVPYHEFIWQTQGVCIIGVYADETTWALGGEYQRIRT
jgi:Eukaryotic aspartyl protease